MTSPDFSYLDGKRVLVAGGGGFIGGHLVSELRQQGVSHVRSVDQKPVEGWYQVHQDCENVVADLSEKDACARAVDGVDIVFNLERAFKVKIPRGKIVEDARGVLPEAAFEEKGHLTEAGLKRLREYLSEVPADRFRSPMKVADIPKLFTPETFCKIVVRGLRAGPSAPKPDA